MSETTIRGKLDQIEVRPAKTEQSPIGGQLHRMGDVTALVFARLAQLEDRLEPVRSPFDRAMLESSEPVAPVSPLADTLRLHNDALQTIVARLDHLLADVEL